MYFYCELRLWLLLLGESDPLLGIRLGVGVREAIPQAAPDLVVISVASQRRRVTLAPRSKYAAPAVKPHALKSSGAPVIGDAQHQVSVHDSMMPDDSFQLQDAVVGRPTQAFVHRCRPRPTSMQVAISGF
jgi:hypothetical protein